MMYSLLMILAVIAVSTAAKSSYVKGKLSYEPSSLYEYSLSGEMHDQRGKEVAVITCKVKLQCMSEGTYGGKKAVHYCIEMENVIQTFFEVQINQVTFKQTKYLKSAKDLTLMMEKDFCFLRSEDGLLLKVLYPRNESKAVVNLKKTIVSAFQANFAKSEKKVETDSQSKHVSHYKYETKGDDTVEHRTVNSEDVSKYSGQTGKKGVAYRSKEDVEVDKNKIIRKSNGESTTSLTKVDQEEEKITGKNSDIPSIETKTKYTLKLIKKVPRVAEAEENEQQQTLDEEATIMDDIIAQYDEYEHDVEDMEELHEQLTDIQVIAKRMTRSVQTKNESDEDSITDIEQHAHTMQNWRELLHLESKHGPLNDRESKLKALIGKLEEVGLDKSDYSYNLRMIIYDLLSSEGSLMAQQALINALRMKQMTELDEEYHSIVTAITLLESVELASLFHYKEYVMANGTIDEQLLLSLATLGRHKNVEKEVVDTIIQLMEEQGVNDTDTLIYFIHALGNTGSRLIIPHLTPLLLNTDLQVTVIDALRTVSTDKRVLAVFSDLCRSSDVSADTVIAIIESLRFPHESFLYYPEPPEQPEVEEVGKQLITNIVNAAIQIQDDALYNATQMYLQATATDFTKSLLNDLIVRYNADNSTESQSISKRAYTRDWSSRRSYMFNSVASYTSRRADKRNYPFHKAFLWDKRLGPSKIHARIAVGGFAGAGRSGIKVLGKAVVKLYCFGRTYTAMEGYYMTQYDANTRASRVRKYVKVLGRTVLNRAATAQARLPYKKSWSKNLGSRRLFSFRKRVYVKVGFLTFTIRGDVRVGARLSVYVKATEAKSDIQFGPTFIINGGAHLTIAKYRIGLKARASIGYYITPKASVTMCDTAPKADVSTCFGIFHGSNGLNVNVYAYYKKYGCRVKRRRWRVKVRCKWSREKRLGRLSSTYRIRGLSQRLFKGQCAACSCGGALRRFCSAHTGTPGGASGCSCQSTGFQ